MEVWTMSYSDKVELKYKYVNEDQTWILHMLGLKINCEYYHFIA